MSTQSVIAKFDPTNTHLALVVQALDSHQVKVQAVVATQDLLNTLFSLSRGTKLSVLEWVSPREVALCLTNGSIQVYSPSSNSIVGNLESSTNLAITDFHFSNITRTAWSADIGGNLCEWDLLTRSLLQKFALTDMLDVVEQITKISSVMYRDEPHLLIGTQNVYLVDVLGKSIVKTFPAHIQPLVLIVPVPDDPDLFFTAAEGDRFANIYSISRNSARSVLVAQSAITQVDLGVSGDMSMAAVITENGIIEIFKDPLKFEIQAQESSKKRRKQLASSVKSCHSDATLKYSRPADEIRNPDDELLPISCLSVSESVLYTTWMTGASLSQFDAIAWHTESGFAFSGSQVITKAKSQFKSIDPYASGHDVAAPKLYTENAAVVSEGNAFQNDLEFDEDDEDEDTLAEKLEKLSGDARKNLEGQRKRLQKHTAGTLTVVLSQALRNNDHSLLETVLANRNSSVVQNTVSRLDSSLAVVLLDRLGERISLQHQKSDQLNFWLKWIIIIHGGMISSIPNLSNKLANLHAILTKKASTLPRLLELQGRLDMIDQQVMLRREILKSTSEMHNEDGESDVEYVEEIDDAVEQGIIGSEDELSEDMDMGGEDDYQEEDEVDMVNAAANDEDGFSDVETAVQHNDVFDEED